MGTAASKRVGAAPVQDVPVPVGGSRAGSEAEGGPDDGAHAITPSAASAPSSYPPPVSKRSVSIDYAYYRDVGQFAPAGLGRMLGLERVACFPSESSAGCALYLFFQKYGVHLCPSPA